MRKIRTAAVALALLVGMAAPAGAEPALASQSYQLPAHLELDVTATWCDNTGSTIEFGGTLVTGGLSIDATFKNNVKGTHQKTVPSEATFEVTPSGGTYTVPKQPVLGGVGGNPWISVQFTDDDGKALGKRILLGRCVQGLSLKHISQDLLLPAGAAAFVESLECSNKRTTIALSSAQSTGGLNATIYLDNNKNKVVHQDDVEASVSFSLFPALTVPKQGSLEGVGGNPLISLQFNGDNGAIGDPIELGRCVQLGK